MGSMKYPQQLVGTALAVIAFTLSACASAAAPTSHDAPGVSAGPSAEGREQPPETTPTPPPPALATRLQPPRVPVPPTTPAPPDPTLAQGEDCGQVEMVATGLIDAPGNAPAVECFWQAYQQCPAMGKAQLFVYQRFFETHNERIFRLDGTSGQCVISEELRAYPLAANIPQTSMYTCAGLTRDSDGLHFLGCGSDGDFTIPATPIGTVSAPPAAVGVPTVRTVTLADDGQTISLPTGTAFLLSLDSTYDWQVQVADPMIVSPDPDAAVPPESQGIFRAAHQGQTTLTATGNPTCYNATPRCLAPSRRFTVQILAT